MSDQSMMSPAPADTAAPSSAPAAAKRPRETTQKQSKKKQSKANDAAEPVVEPVVEPKKKKKYTRKNTKSVCDDAATDALLSASSSAVAPPTAFELLRAKRDMYRAQWLHTLEGLCANSAAAGSSSLPPPPPAAGLEGRLAQHLERGAFNHAILAARNKGMLIHPGCPVFLQLYVARTCTLWRNFRKSPELVRGVVAGDISCQDLETMTAVELDLGHWREELDAKSKRDASKFETRVVANTSKYTCKMCQSTQCSYSELQTRGGDEAYTIFVECLNCSFRWQD